MEVTFRFRKDLVDRVRRKAEASGTTIEQVVIDVIERFAVGEEMNFIASTKKQLTPTTSVSETKAAHESESI